MICRQHEVHDKFTGCYLLRYGHEPCKHVTWSSLLPKSAQMPAPEDLFERKCKMSSEDGHTEIRIHMRVSTSLPALLKLVMLLLQFALSIYRMTSAITDCTLCNDHTTLLLLVHVAALDCRWRYTKN